MRRLARSLASTLTTRRLLELVGLALLSDLDEAQKRSADATAAKYAAQDALEETKRLRFQDQAEFRRILKIEGINLHDRYTLYVHSDVSHLDYSVPVKRFRFDLRPMNVFMDFATLHEAEFQVPLYRRMFAENTARKFSDFILEHIPAEITKQLEAQL